MKKITDIWNRNMESYSQRYGIEIEIEEVGRSLIIDKMAKDASWLPAVEKDGRLWNLNSVYKPQEAAEIYARRYENGKTFTTYFIFGIADGRAVKALYQKIKRKSCRMVIYEPREELFFRVLQYIDLTELIDDENVVLLTGDEMDCVDNTISAVVDFSNRKMLEFCILPGYDILYTDKCERYIDLCVERIKLEEIKRNTIMYFGETFPQNMLFNIRNMIYQYDIKKLRDAFQKLDYEGVPAVIVSAGPSLDKNLHLLKTVENKVFIIVVDAALRAVVKEGIRPDLVVSIDAGVPDKFFEVPGFDQILLAGDRMTRGSILEKHHGKIFYYNNMLDYWDAYVEKTIGYSLPFIPSGGSVSTDAFSLACYLGFRTIILIGQDLAFTDGRGHNGSLRDSEEENCAYVETRVLTEVEGIHGEMLQTDVEMKFYLEWFEKAFAYHEGKVKIIDATEGGAKIKGTLIQTLQETLDEECKKTVDFKSAEDLVEPTFSPQQRKEMEQYIHQFPVDVEKFKIRCQDGLELYSEFYKLCKEKQMDEKNLNDYVQEISRKNEEIENDPLIGIITFYSRKKEYELKETIYTDEDMSLNDIAERGIALLKSYIIAADELLRDIEKEYREVLSE